MEHWLQELGQRQAYVVIGGLHTGLHPEKEEPILLPALQKQEKSYLLLRSQEY